jgi:transcriptional regulator with XRE-family HTH domain
MTEALIEPQVETTDRPRHPNRLAELRDKRMLSQTEVAKLLGMTPATINRHERGNRSLDALAIERYARFYNVSPFELFVPADSYVEYEPVGVELTPVADEVKLLIERNNLV